MSRSDVVKGFLRFTFYVLRTTPTSLHPLSAIELRLHPLGPLPPVRPGVGWQRWRKTGAGLGLWQMVELANPVKTIPAGCVRIRKGLKAVVAAQWSGRRLPMS